MSKRTGKSATRAALAVAASEIDRSVMFIPDQRVMLDSDLATFYGVSTKGLNRAVKRNTNRFPEDFAFQPSA
jgi:hypothetical protein